MHLLLISFLSLIGIFSDEPCVVKRKLISTYENQWCNNEIREYKNCNDTNTYYLKMYSDTSIRIEGNIIEGLKEGLWKYYWEDRISSYNDHNRYNLRDQSYGHFQIHLLYKSYC